jgi:hypothetical protein
MEMDRISLDKHISGLLGEQVERGQTWNQRCHYRNAGEMIEAWAKRMMME